MNYINIREEMCPVLLPGIAHCQHQARGQQLEPSGAPHSTAI